MKPILFDLSMVSAVASGQKTMMRILMEPQPMMMANESYKEVDEDGVLYDKLGRMVKCPYGHYEYTFPLRDRWRKRGNGYEFYHQSEDKDATNWQGRYTMPKNSGALQLVITNLYVERYAEMSDEEFESEGMRDPLIEVMGKRYWNYEAKRFNLPSKMECMQSFYRVQYPDITPTDWMWVIHFQHMSEL